MTVILKKIGSVFFGALFLVLLLTACNDPVGEELFNSDIELNNQSDTGGGAGGDPDPIPPPPPNWYYLYEFLTHENFEE